MSTKLGAAYLVAIGLVVLFVGLNVAPPFDPVDLVVASLIVFGPWIAGAAAGWLLGKTWAGVAAAIALGVAAIAVTLVGVLFLAGGSQDAACGEDECFKYLGHWMEASLATQWPIYAVAAWAFSVIVLSQWRRFGKSGLGRA